MTTDELIALIKSGQVGNNRWKLAPYTLAVLMIRTDDGDALCPVCAASRDLTGHRWHNSHWSFAANTVKLDQKHANNIVDAADNTGPYVDYELRQRLLIACGLADQEGGSGD